MTGPWHTRHPDKAVSDRAELLAVVRGQKHLTLALAGPYLVTVNHGFDETTDCFYFHCARQGRKLDAIREDPRVYGQLLEDREYKPGECDHAFRTVQFEATAELVEDPAEKLRALALMVDQLEPDPGPVRERLLRPERMAGVCIVRLRVVAWSGKRND